MSMRRKKENGKDNKLSHRFAARLKNATEVIGPANCTSSNETVAVPAVVHEAVKSQDFTETRHKVPPTRVCIAGPQQHVAVHAAKGAEYVVADAAHICGHDRQRFVRLLQKQGCEGA